MGKGQMILILTQDWPTWYYSTQSFPKHERTCFLTWNKFIYQHVYMNYMENFLVNVADCKRVKTHLSHRCDACVWGYMWLLQKVVYQRHPTSCWVWVCPIAQQAVGNVWQIGLTCSCCSLPIIGIACTSVTVIGASSSLSFSFSFSVAVCYDTSKYWGDKSTSVPST